MIRTSLATAVFFTSSLAFATVTPTPIDSSKVALEVSKVKTLIPKGFELAGAYSNDYDAARKVEVIELRTGQTYLDSVAGSYIYADLNKDGILDLAVAVENPPATDATGEMSFGSRSLLVYFGTANGGFKLAGRGDSVVLAADEGGVFGDPLESLTVTPKGTLQVNHYGGSRDRWGIVQSFQYRKGQFYLIGLTNTTFDDITLRGSTTDTNLLTGNRIITIQRGNNRRDRIIHKHVKVHPLEKLADAKAVTL